MNSNEWDAPDWLSMKWPRSSPVQPIYSPYINECGDPFEERFGNPAGWNQFYAGPQESNSFGKAPPTSPAVVWNSDIDPIPPLVEQHAIMTESGVRQRFPEEGKGGGDGDDGDLTAEDCETPWEVLSPTAKNSYRPAWKSLQEDQNPEWTTHSPHIKKRQKIGVSADEDSHGSKVTPEQTRRRSQRKPSLSIKASQSYTSTSTESSSPVMPTSQDSQSRSDVKTKKSHNLTEKKYRNRLNGYFDNLLSAIPRRSDISDEDRNIGDIPEKKVSKGEVLVLALEHIRALEIQTEVLEKEKRALAADLERVKALCAGSGSKLYAGSVRIAGK